MRVGPIRLLPVLAALFAGALLSAQQPTASRPESRSSLLNRAEMEADLAVLEAAIREKWAYLELREKWDDVNLEALAIRARSSLRDRMTRAEFHQVVVELVAGLKDGHASVDTPGFPWPKRRWPFRVEELSEGLVVVETTMHGPEVGERVRTVAPPKGPAVDVEDAIADLTRTEFASTDRARRYGAVRMLQLTDAPVVVVGLERRDGSAHEVAFDTVEEDSDASRPSKRERCCSLDTVADGIARLKVRSFMIDDWATWRTASAEKVGEVVAPRLARIDACFKAIGNDRALIVDLRGNGGGLDLIGMHVAKYLLSQRFVYTQRSNLTDGKWTPLEVIEGDPFPSDQRFNGPLAILIDERCFSASDNFLRAILENRDDVIVVGRPTHGGTGSPATIVKLPASETSVRLCAMRVYSPKGALIEGSSTFPTIPVRCTAADFIEKRDPDLGAAIQALRGAESRAAR